VAYGRGRPIDSYKTIVSTDDGQCNAGICEQLGYQKKSGNVSPDVYVTATLCED